MPRSFIYSSRLSHIIRIWHRKTVFWFHSWNHKLLRCKETQLLWQGKKIRPVITLCWNASVEIWSKAFTVDWKLGFLLPNWLTSANEIMKVLAVWLGWQLRWHGMGRRCCSCCSASSQPEAPRCRCRFIPLAAFILIAVRISGRLLPRVLPKKHSHRHFFPSKIPLRWHSFVKGCVSFNQSFSFSSHNHNLKPITNVQLNEPLIRSTVRS